MNNRRTKVDVQNKEREDILPTSTGSDDVTIFWDVAPYYRQS